MYIIFGIILTNFSFLIDIPKLNYLQPVYTDNVLDKGIIYKKYLDGPLVIMGHSGTGPSAVFNDLNKISQGDEIILHYINKKENYYISNKKLVSKKENIVLENKARNLYLVTCDLENYTKQWLILAKNDEER